MNHADVKRVEEVRTSYEVNRFIDLGWVLLQVFPGVGYQPQDKWPFYIMGWVKDNKAENKGTHPFEWPLVTCGTDHQNTEGLAHRGPPVPVVSATTYM